MSSKLKYLKGLRQFTPVYPLWEYDTYLPSSWRPMTTRVRNKIRMRCFLTGRFSAVDKRSYLTRMPWKYFAKNGYLPGVKKSSW